ncbi:MAG: bifunctional diguanylate cyclase/phosphodiesterase [Scandinavium sp.]|uniref:bifunctional diguanylate cyclase/phosphodiesterase n=1 Tax=Scandinavium sp. TaxID=2830653 RepID=UPI003F382AF4
MLILKEKFSVDAYPLTLTKTILLTLVVTFCFVLVTMYAFLHFEGYTFLDTMSEKMLSAKKATIERAINDYIDVPLQSNAILVHAIGQQEGDNLPVRELSSNLVNNINNVFSDRHYLNLLEFGSISGDFIAVSHDRAREDYLALKDASTAGLLTFYSHLSTESAVTKTAPDYDPRRREWYTAVAKDKRSHWTRPFIDYDDLSITGIAWSSPAFNRHGKFVGVVASELHVDELNQNLQKFKPYPNSILLIVNEQHELVASSLPAATQATSGKTGQLLTLHKLSESRNPEVVAAGNAIRQQAKPGMLSMKVKGQDYYVDTFAIQDQEAQLNWKGVIISPAEATSQTILSYGRVMMLVLFIACGLGLLAVVWVLSRATRPLLEISRKADELVTHRWTPSTDKRHFPEIASLETTFMALSHKLAESFELQRKKIEEDEVTQLWTRAGLLQQPSLYKKRNLMALLQIGNMYSVVNALGSEFGDAFINEFIRRLRDLLPTDTLIARDTTDKLLVIFPGMNQDKDCQRYREILGALFMGDAHELHGAENKYVYTGNVGMVLSPITEASFSTLRREVGIALLQAGTVGNGVVTLFSQEMYEHELYNIQLHEHLNDAIHHHEFHLVLQPIIDQRHEGRCREGECLLRWHSQALGDVSPDRFIPLAEETGLIVPLGKWVIEEACRELAAMIARGAPQDFLLHINVSAIQLLQQDFAWHLIDSIRSNGLANSNICIEITESVLMQDMQRIGKMLGYLRRHGISISLDDFGSGFSSLSYLHALPFDSIKIDRNFVSGVMGDEKAQSVINSLIVLASGFNVPLIAEGIEDESVMQKLKALGCQKAQGYYFRRPSGFSTFRCEAGEFYYQPQEESSETVV